MLGVPPRILLSVVVLMDLMRSPRACLSFHAKWDLDVSQHVRSMPNLLSEFPHPILVHCAVGDEAPSPPVVLTKRPADVLMAARPGFLVTCLGVPFLLPAPGT